MAETKRVIIDIQDNLASVTANLVKLRQEQAKYNKTLKETEEGTEEFNNAAKGLQSVQQQIKDTTKQQKLLNKELDETRAASGSYDELVAQTNRLKQQLRALPNAFDATNKEANELKRQINQNTQALKGFDKEVGDNFRNVGNYESALDNLGNTFPALGQGTQQASQAFRAFNLVLKANPILLVVGLLSSLVGAFFRTREGGEELRAVMDGANAAFQAFIDVIAPIGKQLIKTIIAPFKSAFFVIQSVSDLVNGDFTKASENFNKAINVQRETAEGWVDTIKEVGDNIEELNSKGGLSGIAERAREISLAFERLDDATRNNNIELERQNQILKNLRLEAANRALSEEERLALVDRITKTEEALERTFNRQISLAKQRLDLTKENNALADSTKEDLEEEARLERDLNSLINERTRRQIEAQNAIDDQRLKAEAQRKASRAQEIKQNEADLELFRQIELEKQRIRDEQSEKEKANLLEQNQLIQERDQERLQKEEENAIAEAEIQKTKNEAILDGTEQLFGALDKLAGENAKTSKKLAIAQALINTYQGATKALAQGGIAGIIGAATVVATGIANVSRIASTPVPTAAKGANFGTFNGPRHSGGGIDLYTGSGTHVANVEGGEDFVVLKRGVSALDALSQANMAAGGRSLGSSGRKFQQGGKLNLQGATSAADQQAAFISALQNMKAPVVSVEDINTGQSNFAQVEDGANL